MIILDTNVIAEPMRPRPDPRVVAWIDRQPPQSLFTTSVTVAELLVGIEILPAGRKRDRLKGALTSALSALFAGRILPFDQNAAASYAVAVGWTRRQGQTIGIADGLIAAIAISHGVGVATRDVSPFIAVGVPTIDPWTV